MIKIDSGGNENNQIVISVTIPMLSKLRLEDTGFEGNGGGILSPPPKKVGREKILSRMFSTEYFSKFICNSYVDTIFALLERKIRPDCRAHGNNLYGQWRKYICIR